MAHFSKRPKQEQPSVVAAASIFSGPRQEQDIDECPDCGRKWAGPPLAVYLKEGESPAECIARNRADVDATLTLLAQAKQEIERLSEALTALVEQLQALAQEWRDSYDDTSHCAEDLEAVIQGIAIPHPETK